MRIGVNCYMLQPNIGGIRQYFFNLFNELLINDQDNEYIFFYFDHNLDELEKLNSVCWRNNSIRLEHQKDLYRFLDKIDLYFCPFSVLCPRPLPIPSVYTLPDIQEVYYPQFFTHYLRVARAYHYTGSSKMADCVITHSDFSKKSIVRFHKIPRDKVIVAYHSVDEKFYHPQVTARCPDMPLPDKYIFYPANHWVHKNHDLLFRALSWLKNEKQIYVNIVLTGFDKEDGYPVERKVMDFGISEQVYQLGYVSVEEMVYLYNHADLLVFPSLFEGFGIPLVEAMATGCPVLAARSTSLPEIGGDAACYFDPSSPENLGKEILKLLNDSELRGKMAARGKERVKQYSAGQLARKHIEAFHLASASFTRKRYLWFRLFYKYYHCGKILLMPVFYAMLYDFIHGKLKKLRSLSTTSAKI